MQMPYYTTNSSTYSFVLVAEVFGVSVKTVRNWRRKFEQSGGLEDKERAGRPAKLSKEQQEIIKKFIAEHKEQVWTARRILNMIICLYGVVLSVKYLPQLLRQIGLSFHKAVHILFRKNGEKAEEMDTRKITKDVQRQNKGGMANILPRRGRVCYTRDINKNVGASRGKGRDQELWKAWKGQSNRGIRIRNRGVLWSTNEIQSNSTEV